MNDELIVSNTRLPDDDLLTMKQVAEIMGWSEEKLRSYVDVPGFKDWVEARPKPRSKGVGYPPESLMKFERLKSDVEAEKVTPKTLAGWMADTVIVSSARSHESQAIVLSERLPELVSVIVAAAQVGESAIVPITRLTEALERVYTALPLPDDRLWTMKEAHAESGVPLSILRGLRVQVGRRLLVRRSDVMRWLSGLNQTE